MAGAEGIDQFAVVLRSRIDVADQQRNRRTSAAALIDPGQDLDLVGLVTLFNFTWSGGRARLESDGLWVESLLELNLRESAPARPAASGDTAS